MARKAAEADDQTEVWVREYQTFADDAGAPVTVTKEYPCTPEFAAQRVGFYNSEKPPGIIITRLDKQGGVPVDLPTDPQHRRIIEGERNISALTDELEQTKRELARLKAQAKKEMNTEKEGGAE